MFLMKSGLSPSTLNFYFNSIKNCCFSKGMNFRTFSSQCLRIRGTKDFNPHDMTKQRRIRKILEDVCTKYGFREISTPLMESSDLFNRAVGANTDIMEKELYILHGEEGICLRPEGTAGAVRFHIEAGSYRGRYFYQGPMFRKERPQKGRYRQVFYLS